MCNNFPTQNPDFFKAIDKEQRHSLQLFLQGLETYRYHPYQQSGPQKHPIWEKGPIQAWDYGQNLPQDAPILIAIPSLINRHIILDSHPAVSFVNFLARQGIRSIVIDWHRKTPPQDWDFDDYLVTHIFDLLSFIHYRFSNAPKHLLGYCMGGNLALALAQIYSQEIFSSLILFATPWDFGHFRQHPWHSLMQIWAIQSIETKGYLPIDWLQTMFLLLKPLQSLQKFIHFAKVDPCSQKAEQFVAIEDWLNDGIPLSGPVARTCLQGWIEKNDLCQKRWHVGGKTVDPSLLSIPTLIVQSTKDHLVPLSSSQPLVAMMPKAKLWHIDLGHIGMMTSGKAEGLLWQPLAEWINR